MRIMKNKGRDSMFKSEKEFIKEYTRMLDSMKCQRELSGKLNCTSAMCFECPLKEFDLCFDLSEESMDQLLDAFKMINAIEEWSKNHKEE